MEEWTLVRNAAPTDRQTALDKLVVPCTQYICTVVSVLDE